MEITYEEGFVKFGSETSSSNELSKSLAAASFQVQQQVKKLGPALEKYSEFTPEIRRRIKVEMTKVNDVRYMNIEYLAAALSILEKMKIEGYRNTEEDFDDFIRQIFDSEKEFNPYYKKLSDAKKESVPGYKNLMKKVLYTYCYKIFTTRL